MGCAPWDAQTYLGAANSRNIDILRWADAEGCPVDGQAISDIAYSGNIEMLKWCRAKGFVFNAMVFCRSVQYIDTLKWLYAAGCPMDARACSGAAAWGHLDTLKWLRSVGCPWSHHVFISAASMGAVDVIQWAYDSGCTWPSSGICEPAHGGSNYNVLEWTYVNLGCRCELHRCCTMRSGDVIVGMLD
jgi:hypothetical protein